MHESERAIVSSLGMSGVKVDDAGIEDIGKEAVLVDEILSESRAKIAVFEHAVDSEVTFIAIGWVIDEASVENGVDTSWADLRNSAEAGGYCRF